MDSSNGDGKRDPNQPGNKNKMYHIFAISWELEDHACCTFKLWHLKKSQAHLIRKFTTQWGDDLPQDENKDISGITFRFEVNQNCESLLRFIPRLKTLVKDWMH
jgi:hypothetical protein